MFRLSWLWRAGGHDLTATTLTKPLTTKGLRRPRVALTRTIQERRKRRRIARGRLIIGKEAAMQTTLACTTSARDVALAQLANAIFSKGHRHVATATNISFVPDGNPATPLVALAGREHVGKTSLLRALFRSAREVSRSNRVLRREAMNFFNVGDGVFNVVDLPGFGGTSVPWSTVLQHAVLLRNFVRCQPSLKMLYYCMDVHHHNGVYVQDIDLLRFLSKEVPNFTIVLTKAEQLSDRPASSFSSSTKGSLSVEEIRHELLRHDIAHPVLVTSAFRMGGIDTLRFDMVMNSLHALPTERLTYTEAKRVSSRLLSQLEMSTVRALPIVPTELDDAMRVWQEELREEKPAAASPPLSDTSSHKGEDDKGETKASVSEASMQSESSPSHVDSRTGVPALAIRPVDEMVFAKDPDRLAAYRRVCKIYRNAQFMDYVRRVSPWRNPLLWPAHVVPTKHPKINVMRCVEDVHNPYLTQATFVVPRADMLFRKPNVGRRTFRGKGRYEADHPMSFLLKSYTIPYFPDIVDVDMHPLPWTFLGSREAYYERHGGRQLGVRLARYATAGQINPLLNEPAPNQPALTQELRALEKGRYAPTIAMLRPPEPSPSASFY